MLCVSCDFVELLLLLRPPGSPYDESHGWAAVERQAQGAWASEWGSGCRSGEKRGVGAAAAAAIEKVSRSSRGCGGEAYWMEGGGGGGEVWGGLWGLDDSFPCPAPRLRLPSPLLLCGSSPGRCVSCEPEEHCFSIFRSTRTNFPPPRQRVILKEEERKPKRKKKQ